MSLNPFSKDVEIISALPDAPNLASAELKRKFDTAGIAIKEYINDDMVPFINNMAETGIADNSILARHFKTTDIPAGDESVEEYVTNKATNAANDVVAHIYWSNEATVTSHFAEGVINGSRMADNSIDASNKIEDYSINDMKLMANSVHGDIIANESITDLKLADGAVISNKIDNAAILNQHITDNSISPVKISRGEFFGLLRQRYTSTSSPTWSPTYSVYAALPTVTNNAAPNGTIIFVKK